MSEPHDAAEPAAAAETVAIPQPSAADDRALIQVLRGPRPSYVLMRFVFLRALGCIYCVAFLILHDQIVPLIGTDGLLPAQLFFDELRGYASFWSLPGLFWFTASNHALQLSADIGLALSLLVLCGVENAFVMTALWVLYLSFVHAGQLFYGYGWETLLLETGFLAIFFCPLFHLAPLRDRTPTPTVLVIMLRWVLFRLMFGAGLIKIRGDPCWRDLTCLVYHYETQPVPHILSWMLNQAPRWFDELGVLFNHLVELVAPFFVFGPRPARQIAGALTIAFQTMLILSGNLSFLNWLTIAIAFACFDDGVWRRLLPRAIVARSEQAPAGELGAPRIWLLAALSLVVLVLSIAPVMNMLSPHQRMNTSFEPFHLVNSYGAFGSVGKQRDEVILQGTRARSPGPGARWEEYEFKCKPGDVARVPCWITPYHYRLDWQMWFAALSNIEQEPWLVHLVYKLLQNDRGVLGLIRKNPFGATPPRYIRAERYRYRFTHFGEPNYWKRERIGTYMPPVSLDNPSLREFLRQQGLLR